MHQVYAIVTNRYLEKHRVYHGVEHLFNCIKEFGRVKDRLENSHLVEMSLLFHDSVYIPKSCTNERDSSWLAANCLSELGYSGRRLDLIQSMILATTHEQSTPYGYNDINYVVDIDLSSLGADEKTFQRYSREIRREYSWVSIEHYCMERIKILNSFLNRPQVYMTEFYRNELEDRAIKNITNAIDSLSQNRIV